MCSTKFPKKVQNDWRDIGRPSIKLQCILVLNIIMRFYMFQITILTLAVVHFAYGDTSTPESSRSRHRCRKPSKEQLIQQLLNATTSCHSDDDIPWAPDYWYDPYFDDQVCAEIANQNWTDGKSRQLKIRSLCPWTVIAVPRHHRFPRTIAEARCCCTRCQMRNNSFQCRPIYHTMIVLRKTRQCDDRHLAIYRPVRYLVADGCTCVNSARS